MREGIDLAQLEAELAGTSGLRAGATGEAYGSRAGELAEVRRAQRQRPWEDASVLLREEAAAYKEIMGPRVSGEAQPKPGGSSFL
jgi:hypothetical protein